MLEVHPVTADRWTDLVALFGESGAYGGCWCMWFRQAAREFSQKAGPTNREELRALVETGGEPGLIGYRDGEPVGWVSVGPRSEFGRVERSPITGPIEEEPVWSIVCFFVRRDRRGEGVATELLDAAVEHARRRGARILEAYPIDPALREVRNADAYVGLQPMFEAAGFVEVARHRPARPVMRLTLS